MTYMSEEKTSYAVGSHAKEDKVLLLDACRAAVFVPSHTDILESEDL